ncbi:MAG: hypothetical protein JNM24_08510 [Bdellovibrionaceae bacterium]|nr:hypothetical protein [Pseudobdellovibrionaceae bacterium]
MGFLERTLTEIGEFFARDILSFAIFIFLSAFLINHLASAQTLVRNTSSITQKMRPKKFVGERPISQINNDLRFHDGSGTGKNWQFNLGLNTAQKAQNNSSYSVNTETSLKFNEDMSMKGLLNYSKYAKNELQSDVSDLLLNLYFMKSRFAGMNVSPYLVSTLPLSKDSTQRQSLSFSAGLGAKLSSQSRLGSGILNTSGSISAQKYFHKFETAINNSVNTSHASNQQISTGWEYKDFGFGIQLRHINSWNYAGAMKDSFFHVQTFSWNVSKQLSFSAGQSSSGTVISPNQEEIEIRLVEDNSSALFLSTNYIF